MQKSQFILAPFLQHFVDGTFYMAVIHKRLVKFFADAVAACRKIFGCRQGKLFGIAFPVVQNTGAAIVEQTSHNGDFGLCHLVQRQVFDHIFRHLVVNVGAYIFQSLLFRADTIARSHRLAVRSNGVAEINCPDFGGLVIIGPAFHSFKMGNNIKHKLLGSF